MLGGQGVAVTLSLAGLLLIVAVHLLTPRFRFLHQESGAWVSASAGVAIAYVFVDILPHLASEQAKLMATPHVGWLRYLEHHAYLVAMAGFLFHYAISLPRVSQAMGREQEPGSLTEGLLSYGSLLSLLVYCFLIGYLVGEKWDHRVERGIFALAMSLHFMGLDHLLYEQQPELYRRLGRYLLAVVTIAGWVLGVFTVVSDQVFLLWFSFAGGGIIVVATVSELPRIRSINRDFLAFVGGAASFSSLLLIVEYLGKLD